MSDLASMNSNLFQIALKNKKILIIVGLVAAILSVIFSSATFIKPKFKSQAIVYPSNLGEYSEESPIEQMMQWFESRTIKENVIKEFNLAEHYDIKPEDKLADYYLMLEYDDNVKISETKYESAEIVVTDTDPELAYKMVNSIIENVNKVIRTEHKKRALEEFKTVEIQFIDVKRELDSVSSELKKMRTDYNIINYSAQSENLVKGFLKTFDGANSTSVNMNEVLALKKNIEEKGGEFLNNEKRFYYLIESFNYWDNEYKKANRNLNRVMTYTNMVTKPVVSYKKVYPIRWLIVAISTFGAVFFAFVVILFQNKIKK
ncbi:MAG: Wzz/FepE/Etk N-terminal domain-containing protein [Flavobacteriales bacterium]